jgi:hypothetical protein
LVYNVFVYLSDRRGVKTRCRGKYRDFRKAVIHGFG